MLIDPELINECWDDKKWPSYAAEPDVLIEQLKTDQASAEADTLLLTIPNQLGVAYDTHVLEAILTTVAPSLGWR